MVEANSIVSGSPQRPGREVERGYVEHQVCSRERSEGQIILRQVENACIIGTGCRRINRSL